ncbi:hypothetical protein Drorol1_Dr00003157 [Drosera rotundifolia]
MGDFGGSRSPERARKRRRKDVAGGGSEPKRRAAAAAAGVAAERMVGRYVMKEFSGSGVFLGKVVEFESGLYRVDYEDGDFEDLERSELGKVLIGEEYFDEELMRRRRNLDELVAKKGAKMTHVGKKGEEGSTLPASSNGVNAVTPMTGSVNGVEKIENEVKVEGVIHDGVDKAIVVDDNDDADSCSDSDEFVHGCDAGLECETPVGVPPDLPPSSGNIGVPEEYVPNLFSVYGFLCSFGACLFLSPFTMDELVGCVNCIVPNSLLDAIHVALLRAIRRHLEVVSSDGSELASKCLRATDWELLDTLTWPVYLVHYLMVMGYFDGNEWKGVPIHILEKHYCTLSAGRKLMVLQILCDNALESEEIRAEMDMREESEVGIDAEEFESVFPESSPKRVHPRYSKTFAGNTSAAVDVSVCSNGKTPTNSSSMGLKGSGLRNNLAATGEDGNSDDCCLCGMDGTLLCCDGCPSSYHSRCIGVSKAHIPDGPWFCPECSIRKTEPTIVVGTSLRGAELFGIDPYEQVFLGTCNHLLVLKVSVDISPFVRYYSCNDIPVVLSALHSLENHSVLYFKICQGILMYWNMPQTILPHQTVEKTTDLSNMEEVAITTVCDENTVQKSFGKAVTKKFSNSYVDSIGGLPIVNFTGKTGIDEIPLGVGSALTEPATSTSLHHDSTAVGPADGANFPVNGTINGKDGGKGVGNGLGKSRSYLGSSFKPNIYINHYVHGEFAASAAANLAVLSSEENQVSAAQASDNPKKALLASVALQTKAFTSAAVRFFWPNLEKKFIEVPRERCSWCLNCQSTTKKACLLNAAALNATRGATKIISKLSLTKNVESGLYGIGMYVLYMEEALHGLVAGPFLDASHRQQWRKQVAQIANCYEIKSLLLELEEHVRAVAFSGEWIKQVDNLMSDSSVTQTACPTGSTQKRGPGRRRKHFIPAEVPADDTDEKMADFTWWRGGRLSKLLFQKGMLPHALLRKAARQGGSARVRGVYYAEGSDVLKRSRQFIWRVAVEMSKNVSQLALQIRYLDHHIRWSDLTRPEQIQDPKGPETEASAFRNARISDKKYVDDKLLYGVKFGHQRHLPSRLMKSIIEKEESNGTEKYWFLEARVPLYLIREYEESTLSSVLPPVKRELDTLSKLQKRQLKASRKDLFTYLVRKRDNLTTFYCASCNRDVFLSNVVKCKGCEGYCHRECASSSIIQASDDVEFSTTCKRCYGGSAFAQNQSFAESPTSPLAIQGQEYQKALTVSKSSIQKNSHQQPLAIATVEGSSGMKLKIKLAPPDSSVTKKSKKKPTTWGLIWKKKNIEETGTEFRSNHILWRADPNNVAIAPVCYLCQKPYNPHLLYIRCPACQEWFHADALELDESKIVYLVGFKCSRCRRIKTPTCPYDDKSGKKVEIKKLRIKSSKSEKVESGSLSRAISERTESIPSTPITPMDDDVLLQLDDPTVIVASNVEPISEQKTEVDLEWDVASVDDPLETEADFEWDAPSANIPQKTEVDYEWDAQAEDDPQKTEVDYEWDAPSVVGPRKLPIRRCVKPEQDDGLPGFASQLDLFASNDHVSSGDNISSHHLSWDVSSTGLENGTVFDYENLDNEGVDFEPQTYFSMGELLDSNDVAQSGVDELANVQNQWEDWTCTNSHDVSQDQYDIETLQQTEPGTSNDDCVEPVPFEQDVPCGRCSQTVPVPDLSCQNCGLNIHSHCSPWEDLPQEESWKCGNCRAWR